MKHFRFRNILVLILSATIILSLAGCGSNGGGSVAHAFSSVKHHEKGHLIADKFLDKVDFPRIDDYISGDNFDIEGYLKACGISYGYSSYFYTFQWNTYNFYVYTESSDGNIDYYSSYNLGWKDMTTGKDGCYTGHGWSEDQEIWWTLNNGERARDDVIFRLQDLCYGIKHDPMFTPDFYL